MKVSDWPPEIVEILAYHETGHAIISSFHDFIIAQIWIANGRDKTFTPTTGTVREDVRGEVYSMTKTDVVSLEGVRKVTFSHINIEVASLISESMAPHFANCATLAKSSDFKDFFFGETGISGGAYNDTKLAFEKAAIGYFLINGVTDLDEMTLAFERDHLIPVTKLLKLYKNSVGTLANALIEKRFLGGQDAHEILCNHDPMPAEDEIPGCVAGKISPELMEDIAKVHEEMMSMDVEKLRARQRGLMDIN